MHAFSWSDWLTLFLHFLSLSLLSIGGAITTVPDMHRFLVGEKSWLSDSQFTGSIALAQAAPGPNVLFVAVLGWNIGMNAGGGLAGGASAWGMAFAGVFATMLGILLPSTTLTFFAARLGHQNKERRDVRAFKMSMAPIVVALLMATGWILTVGHGPFLENLWLWVLTLESTLVVWHTRIHLLWLLAAGALGGVMGWF
jgi:chromate transporter